MFIEEFFFFLIKDSIFTEELFKCFVGIFQREFKLQHAIVVTSLVVVWQNVVGLRDIIKLFLGKSSVNFVFVRMPFWSKPLIGVLNVKCWGIIGNTKNFVVVFELAHFLFVFIFCFIKKIFLRFRFIVCKIILNKTDQKIIDKMAS